jgi:hypothetical protein
MVEDGLTDLDVLKEHITSLTPDRDVAKTALEIYRVGASFFSCFWAERTPALAIRATRRDWRRYDRLFCSRRGCAVGARDGWCLQSGLRLELFWNS